MQGLSRDPSDSCCHDFYRITTASTTKLGPWGQTTVTRVRDQGGNHFTSQRGKGLLLRCVSLSAVSSLGLKT